MPSWRSHNRVVVAGRDCSWEDLRAEFAALPGARILRQSHCPVAVVVSDRVAAMGAVALVCAEGLDVLLLGVERLTPAVRELLQSQGFALYYVDSHQYRATSAPVSAVPGRVWLLTSGTTGTPKLVPHRWETLFTLPETATASPRRWLVPYQVGTYAWYQLVTMGLFHADQTLVVANTDDPVALFAEAAVARVDSLSATPTFWRLACLQVPEERLRAVPLRTITLGGEVVDQAILDRLASLFPEARITHIYASTEAGACIVVKDKRAGFPVKFLERNEPGLPALRIENGRLWIRSPYSTRAAVGQPEDWLDSGDCVEIRGDRVYFVGRANGALINVGGNKAFPADIEAVLLAHPGVSWCRVRAVRSPWVGYLAEADIVPVAWPGPDDAELTRYCAAHLPDYAVPRFWNRLKHIPVQDSLKSAL